VLAPGHGELAFTPPEPGSYELPELGAAADGPLLDAEGRPVRLHELFGDGLALLSFVYASCSDVNGCPLATAVLHRVKRRLEQAPELAAQVRLVSVSFDPRRDTPEVMRRYGAAFASGAVDWRFATAESELALAPLLDAYGQSVLRDVGEDGEELGSLSHILRVFLIDGARRIRNIYTVSFLHADTLLADLRTLALEDGATRRTDAQPAGARLPGPGDDRAGYERADWRTRSRSLAARRGRPADLAARLGRVRAGLPPVPLPTPEPPTAEQIALGRKLFFDRRLSHNGTLSCGMCHIPEQGFTSNELATAVGIEGRTLRRNAPTVLDSAYLERLFHDGRETTLEQQVWGPLLASNEMGNPSVGALLERIRALPDYRGRFEAAFPRQGLGMETLGRALASYERTLVTGDSAFDRWYYAGDGDALSPEARRGFELFRGEAACASCHPVGPDSALFTDQSFHNTGIGYRAAMGPAPATRRIQVAPGRTLEVDAARIAPVAEPPPPDLGRYEVSLDPDDRWKYRTPSLRNVALTAPYMHDGSLSTLADVIAFYARGGEPNPGLDPRLRPLGLDARDRRALEAFLRSLTGGDVETLVADAIAAPVGDPGSGRRPPSPQGSSTAQ
jgi:cytochrome c peroxidase